MLETELKHCITLENRLTSVIITAVNRILAQLVHKILILAVVCVIMWVSVYENLHGHKCKV